MVAGVQVHNWSRGCVEEANLEFVAPTKVYVAVGGEVTMLDLLQLPVSRRSVSSWFERTGTTGGDPTTTTTRGKRRAKGEDVKSKHAADAKNKTTPRRRKKQNKTPRPEKHTTKPSTTTTHTQNSP